MPITKTILFSVPNVPYCIRFPLDLLWYLANPPFRNDNYFTLYCYDSITTRSLPAVTSCGYEDSFVFVVAVVSSTPPPHRRRRRRRTMAGTRTRGRTPGRTFRNRCTRDWLGVKRSASVQCDPRAAVAAAALPAEGDRDGRVGRWTRRETTTGAENQWAPWPAGGTLCSRTASTVPDQRPPYKHILGARQSSIYIQCSRAYIFPYIYITDVPFYQT